LPELVRLALRLAAAALLAAGAWAAQAAGFEGTVTHVTDGDSLWVKPLAGGPARELRLQGIDAPEICQAWGAQSRDALAALVLHRRVHVAEKGRDNYQRTLARIRLGGQDVGAWMVGRGHAWSYHFHRDAGPYARQESQARAGKLGLWRSQAPLAPRDFRKRQGSCK
jgi:endonuclease YncB( thermonuclease family)